MDFSTQLSATIARIESGLDRHLPPAATRPARLHEAMRYSLQAGGKRLRPVLLLAAADLAAPSAIPDPQSPDPLPAAVAIECVHTYSLIHDDLPCMDNDDLRRGRPTCHRRYDEATALLAGDALLTHTFALLVENYPAALAAALVRELAAAAGSRRLIGGQMADLLAEKNSAADPAELEFIHLNKTAAMIEAALVLGGLIGLAAQNGGAPATAAASGPPAILSALRDAGRHLGLAFQIIDDLLDATADTATLGKTAGKDARAGKATFVKIHGLDTSRRLAAEHTQRALAALATLPGNTAFLRALVTHMAARAS